MIVFIGNNIFFLMWLTSFGDARDMHQKHWRKQQSSWK